MENLLNADSDLSSGESDEDYVPAGCVEDSESHSDNASDNEDHQETKKSRGKKRRKNIKKQDNNDDETSEPVVESKLSAEEEKKRVDDLYKDFMKDFKTPIKKAVEEKTISNQETLINKQKVTVTEEFEFAGETVKVQKEVELDSKPIIPTISTLKPEVGETSTQNGSKTPPKSTLKRPGGLSSVLNVLDKKKKMSIIDKTLHDWKNFKKDEGIEEELQTHNKGRGGFIEKQAFLQRSDLRQFELEKSLRQSRRSK